MCKGIKKKNDSLFITTNGYALMRKNMCDAGDRFP